MLTKRLLLLALPFLATCGEEAGTPNPPVEGQQVALGLIPSSEVATWRQVAASGNPDGRFLQAAAYDEKRGVVVMFGGATVSADFASPQINQELWEWSPGNWTHRIGTGTAPSARSGAALVYDSTETSSCCSAAGAPAASTTKTPGNGIRTVAPGRIAPARAPIPLPAANTAWSIRHQLERSCCLVAEPAARPRLMQPVSPFP